MKLSISACAKMSAQEIKEKLIDLCLQNRFGGWSYKSFSLEEDAIFKMIIDDYNNSKVLAFIIEEDGKKIILSPAQLKGERGLKFEHFAQCFAEIANLLINNIWEAIDYICIHK